MIPSNLGLAEKSENLASLLAEFLFLPYPIRTANAPELIYSYPFLSGQLVVFIIFICSMQFSTVIDRRYS